MKKKKLFELLEDEDVLQGEIEEPINLEDTPIFTLEEPEDEVVEFNTNMGITKMLSDLIKDEWEAIDGYKSTIATLNDLGGNEDLIKVLDDISTEEMVHVGELEKCLSLVAPESEQIEDGKEEAEETMENETPVDEDLKEENNLELNTVPSNQLERTQLTNEDEIELPKQEEELKEEKVNDKEVFWQLRDKITDLFPEINYDNLKYKGEEIVFFIANDSKWGGEYFIIVSDEEMAKQVVKDYNQDGYACYDDKGDYMYSKDKDGNIIKE